MNILCQSNLIYTELRLSYACLLKIIKFVLKSPETNFDCESFPLFNGNDKLTCNKISTCQHDVVREREEPYFRSILNTIQVKL